MTSTPVAARDVDAPACTPPAASRAWLIWPPLVAYAAQHLLLWLAALAAGDRYFTVPSRVRADAGLYRAIAERGYELFPCRDDPALAPIFEPDAWCGDTGWFPLYSWLMRLVSTLTGLDRYDPGFVVTEIAQPIAIVLFWLLLRRIGYGDRRGLLILALGVLLPTGVYLHAVFPMALGAALSLGYLHLVLSRRWWWAALAGAAAALCYPLGFLVAAAGAGAVAVLWRRGGLTGRQRLLAPLAATGGPVAGLLAVFGVHHVTVGRWDAYFVIQEHYGNGVHNPVATFATMIREPAIAIPEARRSLLGLHDRVTDIELCWSLGLVALICVTVALAARRGRLHPIDIGLLLYAAGLVVAPLVAGPNVSQYRSHALMLPVLLTLRHLPGRMQAAIAVGSAVLAALMAYLFFTWMLF